MKVLSATSLEMGLAGALGLAVAGWGASAAVGNRAPCRRNIQPEPPDRLQHTVGSWHTDPL